MRRFGFTVSLVLALFSLSLLGINEVERVNQAKKQAQSAIASMDDGRMAYIDPALQLEEAFAGTLWGGSEAAEKLGSMAVRKVETDYFYRVEN